MLKNKLKNRTEVYIKTKPFNRIKSRDVILYYPLWCSGVIKSAIVKEKVGDWIITTTSEVLYKGLIAKVLNYKKHPEYFL